MDAAEKSLNICVCEIEKVENMKEMKNARKLSPIFFSTFILFDQTPFSSKRPSAPVAAD